VHDGPLLELTRAHDVADDAVIESLKFLEDDFYLEIKHVHNTSKLFHSVKLTSNGLDEYAKNYIAGYDSLAKEVVHQIVNLDQMDSREISKALGRPILLINHIIGTLERQRKFKVHTSHTGDYNLHISQVSPTLKRMLD